MIDLLDRRRTAAQTDSDWEGGTSTVTRTWETSFNGTPVSIRTYGGSGVLNNEKVMLSSGGNNRMVVSFPTECSGVYNIRVAYEKDEAPSPNGSYFVFTRNACSGSSFVVKPKMRYNNSVSSMTINGKVCTIGKDEVDIYLAAGTSEFEIALEAGMAYITGLIIDLVMEASSELPCRYFSALTEHTTQSQGFVDTGGVMLRSGDMAKFKMPASSGNLFVLGTIPPSDGALDCTVSSETDIFYFGNSVSYPYGTSQGSHLYKDIEVPAAPNAEIKITCEGSWAHIISLICV